MLKSGQQCFDQVRLTASPKKYTTPSEAQVPFGNDATKFTYSFQITKARKAFAAETWSVPTPADYPVAATLWLGADESNAVRISGLKTTANRVLVNTASGNSDATSAERYQTEVKKQTEALGTGGGDVVINLKISFDDGNKLW